MKHGKERGNWINMTGLKDIKPVGVIVKEGNDHGLIESEVIQGITAY